MTVEQFLYYGSLAYCINKVIYHLYWICIICKQINIARKGAAKAEANGEESFSFKLTVSSPIAKQKMRHLFLNNGFDVNMIAVENTYYPNKEFDITIRWDKEEQEIEELCE